MDKRIAESFFVYPLKHKMYTVDKRPSEGAMLSLWHHHSSVWAQATVTLPSEKGEQKENKKMKALNNSILTTFSAMGCCLAMQINAPYMVQSKTLKGE